ncbi:hypothetical protein ASB1_04770 [Helicobacter heilmannii]|nr:hypothetical protein ASB1_04770 [Helicobacter heilmannii]
MQTINAPSLEEAIIKASSVLGCSVVDLEYEVVQAPSKGFLGLGKKEAILSVYKENPKQLTPKPKSLGKPLPLPPPKTSKPNTHRSTTPKRNSLTRQKS